MYRSILNLFSILNLKDKIFFIILSIMSLFATFLELIGIGLVIPFVSIILDSNKIYDIYFISNLIVFFKLTKSEIFFYSLFLLFFVFLIKNFYLGFFTFVKHNFIMNTNYRLTKKLSNFYFKTNYKFHLNSNSSFLIRNLQSEVPRTNTFLQHTLSLINEIILLVGILLFILIYNSYVFFIIIPILIIFGLSFIYLTKKFASNWGKKQSYFDGLSFKIIMEGLSNIKLAKTFDKVNFFHSLYTNFKSKKLKTDRNINTLNDIPKLFLELIAIFTFVIVLYLLYNNQNENEYILSTLALFAVASFKILPSIGKIITSINNLKFHSESVEIIFNILIKNSIENINSKENYKDSNFIVSDENIIVIKNLMFSYSNSMSPVLENINLNIKQGDYVGIIGKSGAGKTTLIDLMLGLLEPNNGSVKLMGQEVYNNNKIISELIGYVPQTNILADETIRQNIAFGVPENEINDNAIIEVIKLSNLEELIDSLDAGVNTIVGERGVRLSGGQIQRISIARALYNKPKLLFFDEATSSLDKKTENKILEDINLLKGKHTLIMITHNQDTLKYCNTVYEIKNNKIYKTR